MADSVIRGIEMPKNCYECPCCDKEFGKCQVLDDYIFYDRPSLCPLLPLPEGHGRLIDADAIEYTYTTARGNDDGHNWRIFAVGQDEVDDMPTIVPAERGKDDV